MPLSIPETIGTFRADLRRVELTLGSRIDARVAANESWLRNEVQREREEVSADSVAFGKTSRDIWRRRRTRCAGTSTRPSTGSGSKSAR